MRRELVMIVTIASLGAAALGQSQPAPATVPPASSPPAAPPAAKPPATPPPSLDDLLGIPKADKPAANPEDKPVEQPADLDKEKLERKLTDQEAQEAFVEAVRQMGEVAERLEKARDTGLTTQRLHEEILRKLDQLIKNSQSEQSSSSSSSSQSKGDSAGKNPAPAQPKPQPGQQNEAGKGENNAEATPPAMQAAQLRAGLDAARAAWGSLPERLREIFTQGMDEYYSKLYESMTQSYYKKTAQNAGQQ